MNRLLLALLAAAGICSAAAQSPFVDIPPCHWAAGAVSAIAAEPQVAEAQARNSSYLVENALRQVFEGLKCGELSWSLNFLTGAPATFGESGTALLDSFQLTPRTTTISGGRATIDFSVRVTVPTTEQPANYTGEGQADLVFMNGQWLVDYASLAALELPIFPRQ